MAARDQDHRDIPAEATGARFATGDAASGAAALVGDAQSAGQDSGSRQDVVQALRDLVECCIDGEHGFRVSADRAQRADLKPLLHRRVADFRAAADELNHLVVQCGGQPEGDGSAMGAVHRGWVALQAILGDNDQAVLEGCERGQDNALARYRKALEKPMPDRIRAVVERQLQLVQECHDQMKMLRNQARKG